MPINLLIATRNSGKLADYQTFLAEHGVESRTLAELRIAETFEERGESFEVNSREKAAFYAKRSGLPTLADDGGLEIDALEGQPGVRSRRWPGREASDEELVAYCLRQLEGIPPDRRTARLRAVLTLALPDGMILGQVSAATQGVMSSKLEAPIIPGYPYRSLFIPVGSSKSYASLTPDEERGVHHRRRAVEALLPAIRSLNEHANAPHRR